MRLVTRADLDGLVCALLIRRYESIDDIFLVHPQQITDKTVEIRSDDILANLPYHPGCGKWFDHHLLTESNEKPPEDFDGLYRQAPSAAQLVWEYYGRDPKDQKMIEETNRFDSAQLDREDILKPQNYVLLGFTLDPRSGLGNNEEYFFKCLEWLEQQSIREVLLEAEVRQRVVTMFQQNEEFCWTLTQYSRLDGNVVFTDFRRIQKLVAGNRFLIYTLFPEANVSILARWGHAKQCVMVNVGHSIFDRSCPVSIGELMSEYGGGGHVGAGSAPLPVLEADQRILEIIDRLRS